MSDLPVSPLIIKDDIGGALTVHDFGTGRAGIVVSDASGSPGMGGILLDYEDLVALTEALVAMALDAPRKKAP